MISLVHLSNSFIKNIITYNFKENNDSLIYFLNEIIKNSSVYFVGSKTSLKKNLKENKAKEIYDSILNGEKENGLDVGVCEDSKKNFKKRNW